MRKKLYLECYSGISGDMTVAALLDLGADEEALRKALASMPVQGFEVRISEVKKSGIRACDFDVILEQDNHDHNMNYLYGDGRTGEKEHAHGQHETREKEHSHAHHEHVHRGLKEIKEIISQTEMTEKAKKTAVLIFEILAQAEAKAHGVPVDQVHFHEVGAIDSIADIISVAVCLDSLDVEEVIVPVLYEGKGMVRCQHGIIPVPVPAVVFIAQEHHLNFHIIDINGELVTPTGAAIVAAIRTSDRLPEKYCIEKVGIGAGKRVYELPGVLRAMLIHSCGTC